MTYVVWPNISACLTRHSQTNFISLIGACSKRENGLTPERRLECCQTSSGGFKAYNPYSMCCSDGRVLSLGLC